MGGRLVFIQIKLTHLFGGLETLHSPMFSIDKVGWEIGVYNRFEDTYFGRGGTSPTYVIQWGGGVEDTLGRGGHFIHSPILSSNSSNTLSDK